MVSPVGWHCGCMLRWLRRRPEDPGPRLCRCGEPLDVRVVGAGQRWGGEPVIVISCLHCRRCGDVKQTYAHHARDDGRHGPVDLLLWAVAVLMVPGAVTAALSVRSAARPDPTIG